MVELMSALGDVSLVEGYLINKGAPNKTWLSGTQQEGVITVNPAPHVVDTLLHELLHQIRPSWSETSVRRRTSQLMKQMSHQECQAIYAQWLERKT
jgi:hypothetical protein